MHVGQIGAKTLCQLQAGQGGVNPGQQCGPGSDAFEHSSIAATQLQYFRPGRHQLQYILYFGSEVLLDTRRREIVDALQPFGGESLGIVLIGQIKPVTVCLGQTSSELEPPARRGCDAHEGLSNLAGVHTSRQIERGISNARHGRHSGDYQMSSTGRDHFGVVCRLRESILPTARAACNSCPDERRVVVNG